MSVHPASITYIGDALAIAARRSAALDYAEDCAEEARNALTDADRDWWVAEEHAARAAALKLESA